MNNKKIGMRFEKVVCKYLEAQGHWVHFITPDPRGAQPFDIIAVKDNIAMAVECKTLSDTQNYFPITRLEDNQILAFEKWAKKGNTHSFIAIMWKGGIYMISYGRLKREEKIRMDAEVALA